MIMDQFGCRNYNAHYCICLTYCYLIKRVRILVLMDNKYKVLTQGQVLAPSFRGLSRDDHFMIKFKDYVQELSDYCDTPSTEG